MVDQPQGQCLNAGRRVIELAELLDEHGVGERGHGGAGPGSGWIELGPAQ